MCVLYVCVFVLSRWQRFSQLLLLCRPPGPTYICMYTYVCMYMCIYCQFVKMPAPCGQISQLLLLCRPPGLIYIYIFLYVKMPALCGQNVMIVMAWPDPWANIGICFWHLIQQYPVVSHASWIDTFIWYKYSYVSRKPRFLYSARLL